MTVRNAVDSDMQAVQAIYAFHVLNGRGTFEETPPSAKEMVGRRAQVLASGLPYLVAESEGRVLGYCYATPFRPRPAYRYTVEDSVYVANDAAGRGVGTALLRQLISRCRAGQWQQMVAVIGDSGNEGSVRLHRSLGFRPVGTLEGVGFKFGDWLDVVIMQLPLNSAEERVHRPL